MLELARTTTAYHERRTSPATRPAAPALVVGLARTRDEIEAVQRLRFDVFSHDLGVVFPHGQNGLDIDHYDRFCEHVIVRDQEDGRIVGTYRVLTPENAVRAGGYYAETEFDLNGLGSLADELVEVGRTCVHPDYRQGGAIMLLWMGVAEVMRRGRYRYALGCASVSMRDDGASAAEVWRQVAGQLDAPGRRLATPLHRYPVERLDSTLQAKVPPLIKGYMKLGARVCGDPALDPDFNTSDMPVLLDICNMDARYKRHLKLDYTPRESLAARRAA